MSQQKPPTVHLPPIEVNPYKESKYSPSVGRGVPGSRNQMWLRFQIHAEQQLDTAINWLIDTTENNKSVFASNYTHQLQALTSVIQSEINATVAAAGPIHDASPAASIYRELTAVRQLIHQKNLALPQLHAQANAFFSSDPLTKNRQDFINTLVNRDIDAMPHPDI